MNDTRGVRGGQRRRDLNGDVDCLWEREATICESLPECVAGDVLHRDELLALRRFADSMDGADVGMIEGRRRPSLLPEARDSSAVLCEVGSQDFQRDHTLELDLAREPDLTHAAAPKTSDYFVPSRRDPGPIGTSVARL